MRLRSFLRHQIPVSDKKIGFHDIQEYHLGVHSGETNSSQCTTPNILIRPVFSRIKTMSGVYMIKNSEWVSVLLAQLSQLGHDPTKTGLYSRHAAPSKSQAGH